MSKKKKPQPPVVCDYCTGPTEFLDDSVIYKKSYGGKVYLCRPCKAYVGVHKGTTMPLGRLANAELRQLKIEAHAAFDPLWRAAMKHRGWKQNHARAQAYLWLAEAMGITRDQCHIGMFSEDQCRQVVAICRAHTHKNHTSPEGAELDPSRAVNCC